MPENRNQIPPTRERVEQALATVPAQPAPLAIDQSAGGMLIQNSEQAMDVAHAMAKSGVAVRPFMRDKPGVCLAVVIQAIEWRMSPFAVAQKAYSVNDQLAYESQLIQAVILQRAPIKGRIKFDYEGEGPERRCRAWAVLNDAEASFDGEVVEYWSPRWKDISPKNSPLWKSDPDQQFSYFSGRGLSRRHFPDVLLGILALDEAQDAQPAARPGAARPAPEGSLASRMDRLAAPADRGGPTIDAEPGRAVERRTIADVERDKAQEALDDAAVTDAEQDAAAEDGAPDDEADRVPDGVGEVVQPDDAEGFPGDRPTPREARRAEVLGLLRRAAPDGRRALDAAAKPLSDEDMDLVTEEERSSLKAIADEVDQRAGKRGGRR